MPAGTICAEVRDNLRTDLPVAFSQESRWVADKIAEHRTKARNPEIERLRNLVDRFSDWHTESGVRIPDAAVRLAMTWIGSLYLRAGEIGPRWIDPFVSASEDGEIVFEWWREDKRLTVYVDEVGATYSRIWGDLPEMYTDDDAINTYGAQRVLWDWLLS